MTRLPLLLLTVAAATILGACSSSGPGASVAPSPAQLDGRTFLSTDITGHTLVPGSTIRLSFTDGNLSANAGCNTMGGAYTVTDTRLTSGQMSMTEMGCDEPLMAQDQWLSTFLSDVGYILDGDTLTLDDGSVTLTLLDKKVATPDKPIEDTLWILDGIVTGDAVSSVPQGVVASLRIVDGRAEVNFGCNTGGGPVEVAADALTFGPMISTKKACEAPGGTVEGVVSTVLQGTVPYAIDADMLTLDAGDNGLILRAAP